MTIFSSSYRQLEWDAMREARWLVHARQGGNGPAAGTATYDDTVVICTITARAGCPNGVVTFDLNGNRVNREHLRRRLDAMQHAEITEEAREAREWRCEPQEWRKPVPRDAQASAGA